MQKIKKILSSSLMMITAAFLFSCSYNNLLIEKTEKFEKLEDIKKVVVLDPEYYFFDKRKNAKKQYYKSYNMEQEFIGIIENSGKRSNLDIQMVDDGDLTANDLDYFNYLKPLKNDILMANLVSNVNYSNRKKLKTRRNFFRPNNEYYVDNLEVDSKYSFLKEKYGTPYFSVTGIINVKTKPYFNLVSMVVILPFALAQGFTSNNEALYYNFVVNVESGNIVYREVREFQEPLSRDNMKAVVYDSFKILEKK